VAIEIKRETTVSSVITTVTGTLIQVFDIIQSEFLDYDPRGYGTWVPSIRMEGYSGDQFTARIERMKSCD
jgi:hypothetical protein